MSLSYVFILPLLPGMRNPPWVCWAACRNNWFLDRRRSRRRSRGNRGTGGIPLGGGTTHLQYFKMPRNTCSKKRAFVCINGVDEWVTEHRGEPPDSANKLVRQLRTQPPVAMDSTLKVGILKKIPNDILEMNSTCFNSLSGASRLQPVWQKWRGGNRPVFWLFYLEKRLFRNCWNWREKVICIGQQNEPAVSEQAPRHKLGTDSKQEFSGEWRGNTDMWLESL